MVPGHLKYLRVLWSSTCKHPRPSGGLQLGASPPQGNREPEECTKEAGTLSYLLHLCETSKWPGFSGPKPSCLLGAVID